VLAMPSDPASDVHFPTCFHLNVGVLEIPDGLSMYTQRHLVRLDKLVRSTYLLDYTLASMKVGVAVMKNLYEVLALQVPLA
jgi:hypothetical protein